MHNRSPHRNLIPEAEGGRASRGAFLDRYIAMFVGCPPRYELDQRLRLVGKAVRRDFDGAQQLITLEHGAVVISYVEPERPVEQGSKTFGGKCAEPMTRAAIGDDWNDKVCFAGMGDDLRDAVAGKAIVTRKHHDVGRSCSAGAALVGAAKPEIVRIVEDADAGIRRQSLHPLQGAVGAGVVDEDDFVIVPAAHRLTDRADRRPYVILLVEARNDKAECRNSGHAALDDKRWFGGVYSPLCRRRVQY